MTHTISAQRDIMSKITLSIRISGLNTMKARAWLGLRVMKLGAHIIGCPVSVGMDASAK
jgi:hypothetical protein